MCVVDIRIWLCFEKQPCVIIMCFQRCHNYMTEQLGIPVWGSYVIFGLVTLFAGLALGLVSHFLALHLNLLLKLEILLLTYINIFTHVCENVFLF